METTKTLLEGVLAENKNIPKYKDPEYRKQKRKEYYEANKEYINTRKKIIRADPDLKWKHLPNEIDRKVERGVQVMNNAVDMYLLLSEEQKIKVLLEILEKYGDFTECIIRKYFMERFIEIEQVFDDVGISKD